MAIDSRDKRGSCIGFGEPYNVVLPNPDGAALSTADRQQVGASYASGDVSEGGVEVPFDGDKHRSGRQARIQRLARN